MALLPEIAGVSLLKCEKTCHREDSLFGHYGMKTELLNSVFGSLPPTDTAIGTDFKHKRKLLLFFPGSKKIMLISYVTCFLLSALKVKQHMAVCHATSYIHIYI